MSDQEVRAIARAEMCRELAQRCLDRARFDGCTNGFTDGTCIGDKPDFSEWCDGCLLGEASVQLTWLLAQVTPAPSPQPLPVDGCIHCRPSRLCTYHAPSNNPAPSPEPQERMTDQEPRLSITLQQARRLHAAMVREHGDHGGDHACARCFSDAIPSGGFVCVKHMLEDFIAPKRSEAPSAPVEPERETCAPCGHGWHWGAKCDEPAKPEVGPMRNAESPSGVQALGSSGLAQQENGEDETA